MRKVISEISINKYKVLKLDGEKPLRKYTKYLIDGDTYDAVPIYDAVNCIAIEATKSFKGKTVMFV